MDHGCVLLAFHLEHVGFQCLTHIEYFFRTKNGIAHNCRELVTLDRFSDLSVAMAVAEINLLPVNPDKNTSNTEKCRTETPGEVPAYGNVGKHSCL